MGFSQVSHLVPAVVWVISRTLLILLGLAALIFVSRLFVSPESASAASTVLHPNVCLGGWRHARMAGGEPSLPKGSPANEFNVQNSAYLEPNTSAPIFCSGFATDIQDTLPETVTLRFIWAIEGAVVPEAIPVDTPIQEQGPTLEGTTFEKPLEMVDDLIIPALIPAASEEVESTDKATEPVQADDAVVEVVSPPVEAAPAPAVSEPSAPEASPTDVQATLLRTLALLTAETAYADEGPGDFLKISYSLDGTSWQDLGTTNEQNLRDFSVVVPIQSWEDLQNLQIRIDSPATASGHPGVFLDGVEVHIEYPTTFGGLVDDQVAAVAGVADAAMDFINGLADATLAALTGEELSENVPEVAVQEAVPAEPVVRTEKRLVFAVEGGPIRTERLLERYSAEMKSVAAQMEERLQIPDISISDDGLTIDISGTCAKKYFVVLTFREPEDYAVRPQTFASNFADLCQAGQFSYSMKMLPLDTPENLYYLMFADQDEGEEWVPSSYQVPIGISHAEVEVTE